MDVHRTGVISHLLRGAGTAPVSYTHLDVYKRQAWERAMEGMYPGFTRPVLFGYRFYNQDLTTGSLLIEIGGHGNNLNLSLIHI